MANKNEKPYPSTLIASSIDTQGNKVPLANTDDLYDKEQNMMQEPINEVLGNYFSLKGAGPWNGKFNPSIFPDNSIGKEKLTEEVKSMLNGQVVNNQIAAIADRTTVAEGNIDTLFARVEALEDMWNNSILREVIGRTAEDGFFIIDDGRRIGACIIPDGNDGHLEYGWDGNPYTGTDPIVYSTVAGGIFITVHEANFALMNLGTLSSPSSITDFTLSTPQISNNTVTITATPDSNHLGYSGGFNWWVAEGMSYLSIASGQGTNTITLNISNLADLPKPVKVYCRARANYDLARYIDFSVVYSQTVVPVTSAAIELYQADHIPVQNNPIVGPSFKMKATYTPSNANVTGYYWHVSSTSATPPFTRASMEAEHSQICTFNINSNVSESTSGYVTCDVYDANNNYVTSTSVQVYVKYAATPESASNLRGVQVTVPASMTTKEQEVEVYGLYEISDGTTTTTQKLPAHDSEYTLKVKAGNAVIKDNSVLSLTDDAVVGEEITVRATAENPNYDSSDSSSEEYFEYETKTVCNYAPAIQEFEINVLNQSFSGNSIDFAVYTVPDHEEYKNVEWKVTGNKFVTIDQNGHLEISPAVTSNAIINVIAANKKEKVSAVCTLGVRYNNFGRTWNLITPIAAVGDEYVDFAVSAHSGYPLDDYRYMDGTSSQLKWEVLEVVSAQQANEAIVYWNQHNYSSLSPSPKIQAVPAIPINGTSSGTLIATEATSEDLGSVAIVNNTSSTVFYAKSDVEYYVDAQGEDFTAPQIVPAIFTPTTVTSESSEVIPSRGPLRSRSVYSAPTFGDGTEGKPKNRLFLANTSDGLQQGVCVRCTLLDENDPTVELNHVDYYYEFTYRTAGRLPVTSIGFRQVDADSMVTVLANGDLSINAPYSDDLINLKKFVVPLVNGEYVEGQCLFDPDRVCFSSNYGYNTSENWQVFSSSGNILPHKSGQEQLTISYASIGERPSDTRKHEQQSHTETGEYIPFYYCAKNHINRDVNVTLVKETKTYSTNVIKIAAKSSYEVTIVGQDYYIENPDTHVMELNNVWSAVSNAALSITDNDGNPVRDQNNNVMKGDFIITSGSEYFSVGINGYPIRIGNTGTSTNNNSGTPVAKQVTVEATLGTMKATASFTVKMIMQNN